MPTARWHCRAHHITDPAIGKVEVNLLEEAILDSFYLQRLKYVQQTGFAFHAYPAARHTRYDHSLGVFKIVSNFAADFRRELENKRSLREEFLKRCGFHGSDIRKLDLALEEVKLACLLHDIGHGPLSHILDVYYTLVGRFFQPIRRVSSRGQYHERKGKAWVLGSDPILNSCAGSTTASLSKLLRRLGFRPDVVGNLITGEAPAHPLQTLVNGPADADKLDYLLRDAFFTGLPFSLLDIEHLASSTSICKEHHAAHLLVEPRATHTLLRFMASREHLRPAIEYHKTTRGAEAAVLYSIIMATRVLGTGSLQFVRTLDLMEDRDLEEVMQLISKEFSCHEARILEQVKYRQLPVEIDTIDYKTYLTRFQREFPHIPFVGWARTGGNLFLLDLPWRRPYAARYLSGVFVRDKGVCTRLNSYFRKRSGREIAKYLEGLSRASWVGRVFSLSGEVTLPTQIVRSLKRQTRRGLVEIQTIANEISSRSTNQLQRS